MKRRITSKQIGQWLWDHLGPPNDGEEPGDFTQDVYECAARDVLRAIRALGFQVVPQVTQADQRIAELQKQRTACRDVTGAFHAFDASDEGAELAALLRGKT